MKRTIPCGATRITSAEHVCSCSLEQGHEKPCSFSDGNGVFVWLDGYQMSNLREMLLMIDDTPDLKRVLDTGDWIWEIRNKLRHDARNPPNKPVAAQKKAYEEVLRNNAEKTLALDTVARRAAGYSDCG